MLSSVNSASLYPDQLDQGDVYHIEDQNLKGNISKSLKAFGVLVGVTALATAVFLAAPVFLGQVILPYLALQLLFLMTLQFSVRMYQMLKTLVKEMNVIQSMLKIFLKGQCFPLGFLQTLQGNFTQLILYQLISSSFKLLLKTI